jgi:hypothetical protein
MILIGFTWVIVSTLAAVLVKVAVPGRWETHGPTVMIATAVGAFGGGTLGALLYDGINGYGPPSNGAATLGVVLSVVGGLGAFLAYAVDARRQVQA